jgi:DNA-binding IclR family transcriptional regulator
MTARMSEPPVNQSVERAARMLELFSVDEPELTLSEITGRMGLTKATAHRYATALRRAGLMRGANGAYTLGPRIVELAAAALAGLGVIRIADPYMRRVVEETGQTAVLSVWDGEAPVVVRVAENPERLVRIVVTVGSRLPRDSAQGKVFRAFIGGDVADEGDLAAVRRDQLAANAVVVEGVTALAAPVFQGEEIVATLALVGTSPSIDAEPGSAMATVLQDVAIGLSTELGFVRSREETP